MILTDSRTCQKCGSMMVRRDGAHHCTNCGATATPDDLPARLTYARAWLTLPDADLRSALEALTPEEQRAVADAANRVQLRARYIQALARAVNKRSVPPGEGSKP